MEKEGNEDENKSSDIYENRTQEDLDEGRKREED